MRARDWVLVLLAIPFIAVLWPPFYNATAPTLFGLPFFIWYQLAWAIFGAVLTIVVYLVREPGEPAASVDAAPPTYDPYDATSEELF